MHHAETSGWSSARFQRQCVAVCCNVLQCVADLLKRAVNRTSVLQCVAVCVAVCCSVLQCVADLIKRAVNRTYIYQKRPI